MKTNILAEAEKAAKESILHLFLLGIGKLAVGYFTGMTVIIADAISTFADTLGIFASYIGLHLSRKSANENFEYGYYKVETFAAFLVAVGIVGLGVVVFREGIEILNQPSQPQYRPFAIIMAVLAMVQSRRMERKLMTAGQKANSLSLITNARDKRNDMIMQLGVLVAIAASYFSLPYIEGIVTLVIAVLILKEGIFSAKESVFYLLDYWNDPTVILKIKKIVKRETSIIKRIKKIRLRRAGTFIFGEMFVEINPFTDIPDLRDELNLLKNKVLESNQYIKDFSIYSDIPPVRDMKVAIPLQKGRSLGARVAGTLKKTEAYLFVRVHNGVIKEVYHRKIRPEQKNPVELANFLKQEKITTLINNKIHSLAYYNLRRTHQILIYPKFADVHTAGQMLKLLLIDN